MNFPRFFKTDKGEVINLLMIVHMYKNYDGVHVVEMLGNNKCEVSAEDFERIIRSIDRIYKFYKVN